MLPFVRHQGLMRRRSISKYRRLEAANDQLIQELSRLMFQGRCAFDPLHRCGEGVTGHHMIHRDHKAFRHHPLNVPYLCQAHHDMFHMIRTDRNEPYYRAIYVAGEEITAVQTTIRLFERESRLSHHYAFWNLNRFAPPRTVWEVDLVDTQRYLRELITQARGEWQGTTEVSTG